MHGKYNNYIYYCIYNKKKNVHVIKIEMLWFLKL